MKFGSDVCYEFLELLPRLAPGVWVHVHDIFFPHDYPAEWLIERRLALNEQYLLEAFLSFNHEFQVALANYWLCLDHAETASKLWPADGQRRRVFGCTEVVNSITAIIPTIGRAESLRALLDSLAAQTHKPDEVIIADASNDPETARCIEAEARLAVKRIHVAPPNAVRQRMAAIDLAHGDNLLAAR